MKNLKVGDFLIRKEGDETSIAVVKEYFGKEDYYVLQVINSQGSTHEVEMYSWEFEKDGWTTYEP